MPVWAKSSSRTGVRSPLSASPETIHGCPSLYIWDVNWGSVDWNGGNSELHVVIIRSTDRRRALKGWWSYLQKPGKIRKGWLACLGTLIIQTRTSQPSFKTTSTSTTESVDVDWEDSRPDIWHVHNCAKFTADERMPCARFYLLLALLLTDVSNASADANNCHGTGSTSTRKCFVLTVIIHAWRLPLLPLTLPDWLPPYSIPEKSTSGVMVSDV